VGRFWQSLKSWPSRLGLLAASLALALALLYGNSETVEQSVQTDAPIQTEEPTQADETTQTDAAAAQAEGSVLLEHARQQRTDDLDGMFERGFLRILAPYSLIFFFQDGSETLGIVQELSETFEARLNEVQRGDRRRLKVMVIPVPRDQILDKLIRGEGDIAAANLTITPARQERVAFSDPLHSEVSELVITGPAAPAVSSLDDLAETRVHLRPSSSYYEHLGKLNEARQAAGLPAIPVVEADEQLEDYDLIELVNAGVIPAVVVDSHKAAFWVRFFDHITVHQDLAINRGGEIAWALRKDNPELMAAVNDFVKQTRRGTLVGNVIFNRYLKNRLWISNPVGRKSGKRFNELAEHFQRYAKRYDFDWLMIAAQGHQESKLDQSRRSKAGAVGVMQILPSTAADPNVDITDIDQAEHNIHAGVRYLRYLRNDYFSEPEIAPLDRVLFAFAAYNAGPRNIARARKQATAMGFDANRWFGHVEIAASKTISREPAVYVRNIYKYYVAYRMFQERKNERDDAVVEAAD
jgi:membrane-bound lytic murein transglycosylase MltF